MFALSALLLLAAPPAAKAPAAPPHAAVGLSLVGFDDGDIKALKAQLRTEATACGGARVVFVDVPAPCDDACLTAASEKAGAPLIALEALRFGGDVEVDERRFEGGSWVTAHRAISSSVFSADSLTPEACTTLETVVAANTPDPELDVAPHDGTTPAGTPDAPSTTPDPTTPTASLDLHPGWFVAGGGAVVAVAGLAAFSLAAATVEDPSSSGAAKEGATVQGWVGLTMLTVGVVAAGAGAAWAVVDAPVIPVVDP